MKRRHYPVTFFFLSIILLWVCPAVYADDIDVMIVFDNSAKTWVDTHGGMNAFAADAVAKMNQAMTNSNVDLTFNLAHAAQVNYNHSGNLETDLIALQAGTGNLSDVHTWRDTYAADLVAMLVDTGDPYGWVGQGYLLQTMSGSPAYGFTVNAIQSVNISHTMTHEVGHNLGAHHSKYQATQPGPNTALNTYSAGWYFMGTNTVDYHTIMAYNNDGYGTIYQSAPLFSTPLITYQGTAAGDAANGDNARTFRETMGVVSNYRTGTTQAGRPPWITVPASSTTGSYTVSWGASSTSGVIYVLQEATNASFSTGLRTAYSGAATSASISGRSSCTTYYYRVKATKTGYTDSAWRTGSNGCVVGFSLPVTENFNSSTLPTGWTQQYIGTLSTDLWSVSNSTNAGGSAYEMKCFWDYASSGTTRLITPCINTLGMDQITLSFRHFLDPFIYCSSFVNLRVQTSNNKSTWTNTPWSVATTDSSIGPSTVTVNITSNLNSSTTYIAFVVDGDLFQFESWYIDNVSINSVLHVSKDGNCGGKKPCYTTIQAAVTAAKDGDTVKVNQGTFRQAPVRSSAGTVTISGGWNTDFSSRTGTTEMYAPGAEGGGGIRVQPNVRVIAP